MKTAKITGVITPILTPFNENLRFNSEQYVAHAKWLLGQGIHYLSPFGTTGEALSVAVKERLQAVDALLSGGIDPAVLMPGTGLCNLPETTELCRHAAQSGCMAVMTLPPFFFKNANDEGFFQYFSRLIEAVNHINFRICLYHIPAMAGMGFSPELTARLVRAFPDVVIAYKDSSGDFNNTQVIIDVAPQIAVFPGSEHFLKVGLENGAMGCISATCNVNPAGIRAVYDAANSAASCVLDEKNQQMIDFRKRIEEYALIPAMKGILSKARNQPNWKTVRPPLLAISDQSVENLFEAFTDEQRAVIDRIY